MASSAESSGNGMSRRQHFLQNLIDDDVVTDGNSSSDDESVSPSSHRQVLAQDSPIIRRSPRPRIMNNRKRSAATTAASTSGSSSGSVRSSSRKRSSVSAPPASSGIAPKRTRHAAQRQRADAATSTSRSRAVEAGTQTAIELNSDDDEDEDDDDEVDLEMLIDEFSMNNNMQQFMNAGYVNAVDDIDSDDLLVVMDEAEAMAAPRAMGRQRSDSPNASMNDALERIRQIEEDERLARQLQEEMDREEAFAVLNASPASNDSDVVADLEEVARIAVAESQQRRPRIGLAQGGGRRTAPEGAIRAARVRRQPADEMFVVPNVELVDIADDDVAPPTTRRRLAPDSTARRTTLAFPFVLGGQVQRRRREGGPGALTGGRRPRAPIAVSGRSLEAQRLRALVSQLVSNMDDSLSQSYETMLDLVERIGEVQKDGLSKEEIGRLPTVIFRTKEATEDTSCIVCMTDYKNQEKLRLLPCKHRFHKNCIDRWLANKHSCPICRADAHAPMEGLADLNEATSSTSGFN